MADLWVVPVLGAFSGIAFGLTGFGDAIIFQVGWLPSAEVS
jgi:hypothetical protein